ncbi:hypothetical protein QU38_00755, partial [Staphylococcus aureus]
CRKERQDAFAVSDRGIDGFQPRRTRRYLFERPFQPVLQMRDRRAEFVRDIAGNLTEVADQRFDTTEHRVERIRQLIEFVAMAAERDAGVEMTGDDRNCRTVHQVKPAADRPLEQQPASDRQHDQHK